MTVNRETAVGSANKAQGPDEPCEFEIAVIINEALINSGALGWPRECVQTETRIAVNSGDSWPDPQRRAGRIQAPGDAPRIEQRFPNKVAIRFSNALWTSNPCTSCSRPSAVSRLIESISPQEPGLIR